MFLSDTAASTTASGPAGPLFEGQVGAHYLLTLLARAEPRGLPGTTIVRVEFQRASDGHALDDVIVKARDLSGQGAVLEIQVKHAITFAPSDPVFRVVVAQIAKAAARPDFNTMRYELAIATARASWKISGAYQDVLAWARRLQSAGVFMARIARRGLANKDMRTFVETFRANLATASAPHDDDTICRAEFRSIQSALVALKGRHTEQQTELIRPSESRLSAMRLPLGCSLIDSKIQCLGIEVDDAVETEWIDGCLPTESIRFRTCSVSFLASSIEAVPMTAIGICGRCFAVPR